MNYSKNVLNKIPKIIWQTYKSEKLSTEMKEPIMSWWNLNQDYEWFFMDDDKCERFISDHFNDEFVAMYKALPYGIMKSDVWRVAVVYVYGGIYVDTDCVCLAPIDSWLEDHRLIIGVETPKGEICNFAFAAEPRHPALKAVLEQFLKIYKSPLFLSNKNTPIQDFGQFGFSNAILNYHNIDRSNINTYIKAKEKYGTKFFLFEDNKFSNYYDSNAYIWHQVASQNWTSIDYDSWRKHQMKDFGIEILNVDI